MGSRAKEGISGYCRLLERLEVVLAWRRFRCKRLRKDGSVCTTVCRDSVGLNLWVHVLYIQYIGLRRSAYPSYVHVHTVHRISQLWRLRVTAHMHVVCSVQWIFVKDHEIRKTRMPSLLIIVFVFQLALHLINTVGAPIINDIVSFPLLLPLRASPGRLLDKTATLISFFGRLFVFNFFSLSSYGISSPDFILPSVLPSPLSLNSRRKLFAWNVNYEARAPRTNSPSGQSWGDSMIKRWRNMSGKVRTKEPKERSQKKKQKTGGFFFGMGLIIPPTLGQLDPFNPPRVHLTKQWQPPAG